MSYAALLLMNHADSDFVAGTQFWKHYLISRPGPARPLIRGSSNQNWRSSDMRVPHWGPLNYPRTHEGRDPHLRPSAMTSTATTPHETFYYAWTHFRDLPGPYLSRIVNRRFKLPDLTLWTGEIIFAYRYTTTFTRKSLNCRWIRDPDLKKI